MNGGRGFKIFEKRRKETGEGEGRGKGKERRKNAGWLAGGLNE